jgi:uncharacterized membrane protein (UPF0127 family)
MSKNTPRQEEKKIKSGLKNSKNKLVLYALIALGVLVAIVLVQRIAVNSNTSDEKIYVSGTPYCLYLPDLSPSNVNSTGCAVELEPAITPEERELGLSNRQELGDYKGMVFIFDRPANQCMWMKDMNFNLDIIWLNEKKEITKIEKNLSPQTFPTTYCADKTKYVIELSEGQSDVLKLSVGQRLDF